MNQLRWIVVSTAFLITIPSVVVYGQNEPKQEDASMVNTETLACRALLKLGDSDKEATLSYFHGFMSGKDNKLTVDVGKLGDISDQVIDYCIDNPDDPLFKVFERYRSN